MYVCMRAVLPGLALTFEEWGWAEKCGCGCLGFDGDIYISHVHVQQQYSHGKDVGRRLINKIWSWFERVSQGAS
jgi:hypothetical protein